MSPQFRKCSTSNPPSGHYKSIDKKGIFLAIIFLPSPFMLSEKSDLHREQSSVDSGSNWSCWRMSPDTMPSAILLLLTFQFQHFSDPCQIPDGSMGADCLHLAQMLPVLNRHTKNHRCKLEKKSTCDQETSCLSRNIEMTLKLR